MTIYKLLIGTYFNIGLEYRGVDNFLGLGGANKVTTTKNHNLAQEGRCGRGICLLLHGSAEAKIFFKIEEV